jgi:hypothetical protein
VNVLLAPLAKLSEPPVTALDSSGSLIAQYRSPSLTLADSRQEYADALVRRVARIRTMMTLVQRITAVTDQIITETNKQLKKRTGQEINAIQRIAASMSLAKAQGVNLQRRPCGRDRAAPRCGSALERVARLSAVGCGLRRKRSAFKPRRIAHHQCAFPESLPSARLRR